MFDFRKISHTKWIGLLAYPFFILVLSKTLHSQDDLEQAYLQTLNLEYQKAKSAIDNAGKSEIPFFDIYVNNLNDVLTLFFSENDSLYDVLQGNERSRIKVLRASEESSPYLLFFEAEIKMQWAFVKLKFGEQWSAGWSLRGAYKTVKRNIKRYPEFKLNEKSLGLAHIIFGAVPARHQWLLGLFGLEGDVMLGLEELNQLVEDESNIFSMEARLISAIVYSYLLEDNESAKAELRIDGREFSAVESYVSALTLMKAHDASLARQLLEKASSNQPLFNYLIAETYFQEGRYLKANEFYEKFLSDFRGKNNIKDAHFKMSLSHLFLGNQKAHRLAREKAIALGKDYSEVDKNAADLLNKADQANHLLFKLRYAIDGGFYARADSLLKEADSISLSHYEGIELNYRKARLHHLQGMTEQAIAEYAEIFKSDNLIPENYFAPNSLLQLGYIYMQRQETDKAIMYLNQVLKFRKHPYKNSLDSKARIALGKLKN